MPTPRHQLHPLPPRALPGVARPSDLLRWPFPLAMEAWAIDPKEVVFLPRRCRRPTPPGGPFAGLGRGGGVFAGTGWPQEATRQAPRKIPATPAPAHATLESATACERRLVKVHAPDRRELEGVGGHAGSSPSF